MFLLLSLAVSFAKAEEATVAVAANFAGPAKSLAARFSRETPHKVSLATGSTGKFYAQIRSGAPFDVFLSADDETPRRLEKESLAVPGTRFTYAIGKLVLWSPKEGVVDANGEVLHKGGFKRLAIANPKLAPYGAAARQALQKLGLWTAMQGKLVLGENIAQTLQFVVSGNAEIGFVALSQVQETGKTPPPGSFWFPPRDAYEPIRQDAVLLARGSANPAARAFLQFLRTREAQVLIRESGYELP